MMKSKSRIRRARRTLMFISGVFAALATAATAKAQNADRAANAVSLEEVVVTAQHRLESLQDVPLSAQVISSQVLEEQNLNSLDDVSQSVPSLHIGSNGRSANLYIRGIGSGENQAFDQSVGTFIDDIYHGRARTSAATFLDLNRIEVLKGPQSTFFGNNAIAGAFNIVTQRPGDSFDASVRALYGDYGQYAVEGAVGGPLTQTLSVRVAAIADGGSGWIDNVNLGERVPKESNSAERLTLLFKPVEGLDATLKIEGSNNINTGGLALRSADCPPAAPFVAAGFCQLALQLGIPTGINDNKTSQNSGQSIDLSSAEDVLTLNYQRWGHTFTSVSGFYDYHYHSNLDLDATPLTLLNAQVPEHYNQFSQEFRVASPTGQPIEYLGGVYFQTDDLFFRQDFGYNFLSPVVASIRPFAPLVPYLPLGQDTNYSQVEHTDSIFGSVTWNASDRLKVSGGLRGSRVGKDYHWNSFYGTATQDYGGIVALPAPVAGIPSFLGLGTPGTLSGSRSDTAWMPSAKVQYQVSPAAMAYVSYTRGFKAGGFNGADNTGIATNLPFAPEHVNAYEIGLKSEWFDNKILLNLDVFRSDYTDLQVSTNALSPSGAFISLVKNAAASRSQGVEVEAQWAVVQNFRLTANATYLDAYYVNYRNVSPTQLQSFCATDYALPQCAIYPTAVPTFQDLSGRPTEFAPKWSGNVTASYRMLLPADYRLTAEATGILSSSYYLSGFDDPTVQQRGYARLDARLTLESAGEHWALDVIGKNLTNRNIQTFAFPLSASPGSTFQQLEEPRNFAVQARYHW